MAGEQEYLWHDDGHILYLMLSGPDLNITMIHCPNNGAPDTDCFHDDAGGCLVEYFINNYGLDCNVGTCVPQEELVIAWSVQGSLKHIDECQVWVIPVTDDMFASWRATQG
jgi:hypothetical protein